jgi:uncharacterized CHY-type Zn-finger protein
MLTTPADYWFSRCVRERVNWTCENCGKQYHEGDQGLHCSHFFGRGNWSVRLEPLNAFAHCFGCHMHFEGNPFEFVGWSEERLKGDYQILIELSNDIMRGKLARRTKGRGAIATHYKSEFERMQAERRAGKMGRIEFVGWY